jgi:hypothetical protein
MIIKDLDKVFKTLDGRNMKVNIADGEPGTVGGQKVTQKDLTLREVITNSILSPQPQNQREPISGAEKARRYNIAIMVHKAKKQVELDLEDVTLIKDEIGRIYPPMIVGQSFEILDPKGEKDGNE